MTFCLKINKQTNPIRMITFFPYWELILTHLIGRYAKNKTKNTVEELLALLG